MQRLLGAALLLAAGTVTGTASLSNLVSAWGHDFTVTPFEPKSLMVAVATDKATGQKFNLIKMPDGHLMAAVPLDGMNGPPKVDPKDLM